MSTFINVNYPWLKHWTHRTDFVKNSSSIKSRIIYNIFNYNKSFTSTFINVNYPWLKHWTHPTDFVKNSRSILESKSVTDLRQIATILEDHDQLTVELEHFKCVKHLEDSATLKPAILALRANDRAILKKELQQLGLSEYPSLMPILITYAAMREQYDMVSDLLEPKQLTRNQIEGLFSVADKHDLPKLSHLMKTHYVDERDMNEIQKIYLFAERARREDLMELLHSINLEDPTQEDIEQLFTFAQENHMPRLLVLLDEAYPVIPEPRPSQSLTTHTPRPAPIAARPAPRPFPISCFSPPAWLYRKTTWGILFVALSFFLLNRRH